MAKKGKIMKTLLKIKMKAENIKEKPLKWTQTDEKQLKLLIKQH